MTTTDNPHPDESPDAQSDRAIAGGGTYAVPGAMTREGPTPDPLPPGWRLDADGMYFDQYGNTVWRSLTIRDMWAYSWDRFRGNPRPHYFASAREAMDRVDELRSSEVKTTAVGEGPRPTMERPTCGTCPYWNRSGDNSNKGWCQRFPPQLAPNPDRDDRRVEELRPVMADDEWCGEHPDFPAYLATHRRAPKPEATP